ncbi:MAG: TonB-dependent receptor [Verrucomicrobiota bacterium]
MQTRRLLPLLALTAACVHSARADDSSAADKPVVLETVEVTALPANLSINPQASPTAGVLGDERTLLDTPRAATTLTPALIREQGVDTIGDLALLAAGVYAPASYGLLTTPIIRGDTAETYVNGQRLGYNNYGYLPSFNSVEAVDVVRGPASAVFGSGYLVGGYVNYRTKQPSFEAARTEITTKLGTWTPGEGDSFANATFQIDHTAPISETLAYRLSYEAKGGDTYHRRRGVEDERQDFFAALAWKPRDGLRIDAHAQVFWQNTPETLGVNRVDQNLIDNGIYQSDAGPVKLPRDVTLFQPGDESDAWVARGQVAVTREFTPDFSLVNRTLAERVDRVRDHQFGYHEDVQATTIENRTEYHRDFALGGLEQSVLAGISLRYEGRDTYADYDYGNGVNPPTYDVTDPTTITRPAVFFFEQSRADLFNPALFWQHEVELTERLTFLAGLREDFYFGKFTGSNEDGFGGSVGSDQIDFAAFSQAYSLTFKARDELTLYATYNRMQTLGTNGSAVGGGYFFNGPSVNAKDFERPSTLIEAGAKADLFDGRLFAAVSVFQQQRSRDDFLSPADIEVRGVELETVWQPTKAWSLFANATFQRGHYDDAVIFQLAEPTFALTAAGDHELVGFSDVLLNGGIRYTFENGFGAGLRGSWQSEQNLNIATPTFPQVDIPAQFQIDATLFYQRETWSAAVEILNLTDERNWIHNGDAYSGSALISQSLPLRVEATLRLRF